MTHRNPYNVWQSFTQIHWTRARRMEWLLGKPTMFCGPGLAENTHFKLVSNFKHRVTANSAKSVRWLNFWVQTRWNSTSNYLIWWLKFMNPRVPFEYGVPTSENSSWTAHNNCGEFALSSCLEYRFKNLSST